MSEELNQASASAGSVSNGPVNPNDAPTGEPTSNSAQNEDKTPKCDNITIGDVQLINIACLQAEVTE